MSTKATTALDQKLFADLQLTDEVIGNDYAADGVTVVGVARIPIGDLLRKGIVPLDAPLATVNSANTVSVAGPMLGQTTDDQLVVKFSQVAGVDGWVTPFATTAQGAKADTALQPADVVDDLTTGGSSVPGSAEQLKVLKGFIDAINVLLASDEVSLDELQEIVDFIQQNRSDLDALGIANIAGLQSALDSKQAALVEVTQAQAEAGTDTAIRGWTAQRVKQAIDALGGDASSVATAIEINSARSTADLMNRNTITAANAETELQFFDADETNTVPLSGADPWYSTSIAPTSGTSLWRLRAAFGFDINGNTSIFEKYGISDGVVPMVAAQGETLVTTITGLTPGQLYEVYVCHLTVYTTQTSNEDWGVRAGFAGSTLKNLNKFGAINIGKTSISGSNRLQLINTIGYKDADENGEIVVHVTNTLGTYRAWYDGLAYNPVNYPISVEYTEVANGAWSWFSSAQAFRLRNGNCLFGFVSNTGKVSVIHTDGSNFQTTELSSWAQIDDHCVPSFTMLPDGRIVAAYARHNDSNGWYYRISNTSGPQTSVDWEAEQLVSDAGFLSYTNIFYLQSTGVIYQFSRQVGFNPTLYIVDPSDFSFTRYEFIRSGTASTRPYTRYFSNNKDRVDVAYTQGHPRNETNSLWHGYVDSDGFHSTDGTLVKALGSFPVLHDSAERGDEIYTYSAAAWTTEGVDDWIPSGRAWTNDIVRYADGTIRVAYSVMTRGNTGDYNTRRCYYYISTWNGSSWSRKMVAQGGQPLYPAEDDYPGCIVLDQLNLDVAYFSSNHSDPSDLSIANTTLGRTFEIYKIDGETITALTKFSRRANLRPIVAPLLAGNMVMFFEGGYISYEKYEAQIKAVFDLNDPAKLLK